MKTIYSGFALTAAVCFLMMAALWRQREAKTKETGFWFLGYGLHFMGITLVAFRESIPDIISVVLANALVAAGAATLYAGLAAYCASCARLWAEASIVSLFSLTLAIFTYAAPSFPARVIAFSAITVAYAARGASLCFRRAPRGESAAFVGAVLSMLACAGLARVALNAFWPAPGGIFDARDFEVAIIVTQGILHLLLAFSLTLMENKRLLLRMEADAAAKKKAEDVLMLRLRLYEYSADHDFPDLMRKALDETEAITSSRIGFFHFYDEEKGSLSLQAWSTATIAFFCRAEGRGMVYDIDKAGVWADAAREKRPLIHNASLPGKRGLPEGHAAIVREEVVPVLRESRVVAIMGVGNKASDYTEEDASFVSFIADVAFSLVERAMRDARISELNEELARQAMIDELTGLPNRRAFFVNARRELARAKRHGTPCSMLMLDLDGFKEVNDHNGHDAGDRVLKRAAKVMAGGVRETDMAARVGGEEFAVLLPHTGIEEALVLAERLRAGIQDSGSAEAEPSLQVTASIGADSLESGDDIDSLLKRADEALYKAKALGKNRVYSNIDDQKGIAAAIALPH